MADKNKDALPHGGSSKGKSSSATHAGWGLDCGGPKSTQTTSAMEKGYDLVTEYSNSSSVTDQADAVFTTGSMSYETVIIGDDTPRKQPHSRLNFVSNLKRCDSLSFPKKRKVEDTSFHEIMNVKENSTYTELTEIIESVVKTIKTLNVKTKENPNTQRGIKECATKLLKLSAQLQKNTIHEWLEKYKYDKPDMPVYDIETQTSPLRSSTLKSIMDTKLAEEQDTNLKQKILELEKREKSLKERECYFAEKYKSQRAEKPNTSEMGTYANEEIIKYELENIKISKKIESACQTGSLDMVDVPWSASEYQVSKILQGSHINSCRTYDMAILIEPDDPGMNNWPQKIFKDRYPELLDEDCDNISYITQVISRNGKQTGTQNILKVPIKETTDEDSRTRNIATALTNLRYKLEGLKRTKVALHIPTGIEYEKFRKLVEISFRTANILVNIHVPNIPVAKNDSYAQSLKRQTSRRSLKAIIISKEGLEYMQLLKVTKEILKNQNVLKINRASKTMAGNLMLHTEGDEKKMEEIVKILQEKIEGAKVRIPGKDPDEVHLRLSNIDADVTTDDINEAFRMANLKVNVKSLKKGYGEVQTAIIVVPKEIAPHIMKKCPIQIGIGQCKITENAQIKRCNRCWEPGHLAKNCTGEDRSGNCKNCGENGHKSDKCKEKRKCLVCKTEGHSTLTLACPEYRRMITRTQNPSKEPKATISQTTVIKICDTNTL